MKCSRRKCSDLPTYRDSFAAGLNKVNLQLVQDFGTAAAASAGETPAPTGSAGAHSSRPEVRKVERLDGPAPRAGPFLNAGCSERDIGARVEPCGVPWYSNRSRA